MQRPDPSEYNSYYSLYVNQVDDGEILQILEDAGRAAVDMLRTLPPDRVRHRYAPGKWTLGEVLGHIIDTERIFTYRALCIARGDTTPLPGMDQDDYAAGSNAAERSLESLVDEFEAVRRSTVALIRSFEPAAATRSGQASGFPFTVQALAWIIAGHEIHHRKVIQERYLD